MPVRRTKTITVATYPDGTRIIIRKGQGYMGYQWNRSDSSQYKADAIRNAEREGATVTTEPNPSYREPAAPTGLDILRKHLSW